MHGPLRVLLRLEGLLVLALAVVAYRQLEGDWLLFALLFLVPDLSMAGYLRGRQTGAWCYNAAHTYLGPGLVAVVSWFAGAPVVTHIALVWGAHIGFDRVLGYGLKLPTGFGDTHLGRIGRWKGQS